jgi:hypothetical protein
MCDVIAHVERGSSFQQYRSDDINLTRNRIRRKGDEELSNIMALIMPICVTQFKILTMLLYSDVRKIKAFKNAAFFFTCSWTTFVYIRTGTNRFVYTILDRCCAQWFHLKRKSCLSDAEK